MPTDRRRPARFALAAVAGALMGASDASLVATQDMRAARMSHSSTTLLDGRVLIAGGFVTKGSPAGAELFDPKTERFSALPPMMHTRHSHTATRLPDGRVLIVGGHTDIGGPTAGAELFDPRTNRFTPTTGTPIAARADHIAVLMDNGQVLIAGGLGPDWTFLSSAELYDPATGRFTATGSMTERRESHVAVRLRDGRVLVAGGHRGRREQIVLFASAETYDARTGTFTRVGDMQARRHKHDALVLPDGRVMITGGTDERDNRGVYRSTEFFDAANDTFSAGPTMQLPRYKHRSSAVVLPDGLVLLAGGASQAEIFDPARGTFSIVGGTARMAGQFSAVSVMGNGRTLITGGYGSGTGPRASAWIVRR